MKLGVSPQLHSLRCVLQVGHLFAQVCDLSSEAVSKQYGEGEQHSEKHRQCSINGHAFVVGVY